MLNEDLLHFIWKHRFLPLKELKTLTDSPLEVIDPGLYNSDAGPDFLNAKIKIGHTLWVGNVELHQRTSDWYAHGHDKNPVYDSVILHVALQGEDVIRNTLGEAIPQVLISIPQILQERYRNLKVSKELIPCRPVFAALPPFAVHGWMERLLVERLEDRCQLLHGYFVASQYSWETTFFISLSRSFGFGKNAEAFERWARNLPFHYLKKHTSSLLELEALFFGTAGLLQKDAMPQHFWQKTVDGMQYFQRLCDEYVYLKHKYELQELSFIQWKYLRTRPYNFPHVRIAQLAALYQQLCYHVTDLLDGKISLASTLKELKFTRYWSDHYCFSSPQDSQVFRLTERSIQLIEMNCLIPLIYARGKHRGDPDHMQEAVDRLSGLKPENNQIIRTWLASGIEVKSAADTQALLQLQKKYCDRKDCLRCRFGLEYLRCR